MERIEEKILQAFSESWRNSGRKTLSILRYTASGDVPAAGVEGTKTLVGGLSNFRCVVFRDRDSDMLTSKGIIKRMRRKVVFVAPSVTLYSDDKIDFDNMTWIIIRIDGDSATTGYKSVLIERDS